MLAAGFAFADNENYDGLDISEIDFRGGSFVPSLKNSSWVGATAIEINFSQSILTNANFTNANLSGSYFLITTVTNAIFTNANLSKAWFQKTKGLTDAQLRSASNITGIKLDDLDLSSFNFSGLDFSGGNFYKTTISNVNFTNAVLDGVIFHDSAGLSDKQIRSAKSLIGIRYNNIDISEFNFSLLNISTSDFVDCISLNSDFTGSNLASVSVASSSFNDSNFIGANLTSANIYSSNFAGSNFSKADLTNARLKKCSLVNTNLTNANLTGATFTAETDISGATINGADLTSTVENGFTFAHLESTKSYADKNLSGVIFDYNDIGAWNLSGLNLQNTSFFASKIAGTNFSNSDLRGADISVTKGTATYKNTIMSDGVIKNFSMASADESLSIRKYTPAEGGENISAKIAEDAKISNGAKLTLEQGAFFEVANGKTLSVASDGKILINTDLGGSTIFNVNSSSGLVFEDGSTLTVNIVDDIMTSDAYTFAVISFEDDSRIAGLNNFVKDETLFLTVKGKKFNGAWNYAVKGNDLSISINVPEPATYAAIFGALALAFAAYRRRK